MTIQFYRRGKLIEVEQADPADVHQQIINDAFEVQQSVQGFDLDDESADGILPPLTEPQRESLRRLDLEAVLSSSPRTGGTMERLRGLWVREDGELKVILRDLILMFDPELSHEECETLIESFGLEKRRRLKYGQNLYETKVTEGTSAAEKSVELQDASNQVLNADPVVLERRESRSPTTASAETDFEKQWQWPNISAPDAWEYTRGDGILVAVIDRGFLLHSILASNVDQMSSGRFEEDGDFIAGTNNFPLYWHGTFCAAQVAASGQDGIEVSGAAPEAELMLLATPPAFGTWLSPMVIADAVAYAADPSTAYEDGKPVPAGVRAADVLTCAEGPENGVGHLHLALEQAFDFAASKGRNGLGLPMFWAVANKDVPLEKDEWVSHPPLIRVGGSSKTNKVARDCAFGPELDFLAPGVAVYNQYEMLPLKQTGTSFAAPIAAGVCALVLDKFSDLSAKELRELLRKSCTMPPHSDTSPRNDRFGSGIIDAAKAVQLARVAAGEIPGS